MPHTVTERDIQLFGEATGDMNPVHFDEDYARKTVFRGRVAHGVLSIGFISAVLGMKLPGPGTIFISASIAFKAPVRIGDTVVTTCTVREVANSREVVMDCVCKVDGKTGGGRRSAGAGAEAPAQGLTRLMRIFRHFDDVPAALKGAVVAIGNFDGVHRGHQALIAEARKRRPRRAAVPLAVLAFEPHPQEFFRPVAGILPPHAVAHQGAAAGRAGRGCDVRADLRCRDGGAERRRIS